MILLEYDWNMIRPSAAPNGPLARQSGNLAIPAWGFCCRPESIATITMVHPEPECSILMCVLDKLGKNMKYHTNCETASASSSSSSSPTPTTTSLGIYEILRDSRRFYTDRRDNSATLLPFATELRGGAGCRLQAHRDPHGRRRRRQLPAAEHLGVLGDGGWEGLKGLAVGDLSAFSGADLDFSCFLLEAKG